MPDDYPKEIRFFHALLEELPGVTNVCSGIDSLQGLTSEDLSVVEFGHLPHAALRRTKGGLEGEVLIQIELKLEPTQQGWETLEFLAWFVRDQARGGEVIQLRPFALPPQTDKTIQLGRTLKFHIDLFFHTTGDDLNPILKKVMGIGQELNRAIKLFSPAILP